MATVADPDTTADETITTPTRRIVSPELMKVSVIIPVYNASPYLDDTLQSVLEQTYTGPIQVSMYDDRSTDDSWDVMVRWRDVLKANNIECIIHKQEQRVPTDDRTNDSVGTNITTASGGDCDGSNHDGTNSNHLASALAASSKSYYTTPQEHGKGAGWARNQAVEASNGAFLCFLDADDIMMPQRIVKQLALASRNTNAIVGSRFERFPEEATPRYTEWANNLDPHQLYLQRFREITILQPTWFMSRDAFDRVGGYVNMHPSPEDLIFFYAHLHRANGKLLRCDDVLLKYRHVPGSLSFRTHRLTILQTKVAEFEATVLTLPRWRLGGFSIWGVGRDGKKIFNMLKMENRKLVNQFIDIDERKLARKTHYDRATKRQIPIVHFSKMIAPFIVCVSCRSPTGDLARNIGTLDVKEGVDYWHMV
eukprot:TRINITY_DN623_c1_g1_i4.p1 TRINITY_DN623_c1_g1~~TRINITY_DN623_c1_g1_i4.p1  ORF type:complete len:423 (-),score=81.66 TRINITY_DN623_c1_g1_i4:1309-2577(-)